MVTLIADLSSCIDLVYPAYEADITCSLVVLRKGVV